MQLVFKYMRGAMTPKKAVELQRNMAGGVERMDRFGALSIAAGVDVGIKNGVARAAIALVSIETLEVMERVAADTDVLFPYIPGLLAFREVPVILRAFNKLSRTPDILIVDGQGIAHPRRMGIACHLGLELDLPAIGCAKSRLTGQFREPGAEKGSREFLTDGDKVIGAVVRTKTNVKPLFISIGHRVCLDTAVETTMRLVAGYRLPEPVRMAHLAAKL